VSKNVLTPWHLTLLGVGMASVATLCVSRPTHAQAGASIHATARVEAVTIPMRALRAAEAEITRLVAIVTTRVQTDSLAADVLVPPRDVHPAVRDANRVAMGGLVTIALERGTPRRPDEPCVPQCTAVRIVVRYVANE
jgi:hypothetical protein